MEEAFIMQQFDHPHIIKLILELPATPFAVQFCSGCTRAGRVAFGGGANLVCMLAEAELGYLAAETAPVGPARLRAGEASTPVSGSLGEWT